MGIMLPILDNLHNYGINMYSPKFLLIKKLFYLSSKYAEKDKYKTFNIKKHIQNFKLKTLKSNRNLEQVNKSINRLVTYDIDTLLILKILHFINFKDKLDQQYLNNALLKTLLYTYLKVNLNTNEFDNTNKSYLISLIIQNLYLHYKLTQSVNGDFEKNVYKTKK